MKNRKKKNKSTKRKNNLKKKCGLNSKYKYYNFILVATHNHGMDRLI